jgi:hypothetical protein
LPQRGRGKDKGGLTLDTREAIIKGGDTGPSVVPGDPDKSLLVTAVAYTDPELQMPPKGEKLKPEQVAALKEWVKMGAADLLDAAAVKSKLSGLTDKARQHWAYQPVKKPAVPVNKNQQWCRTPVDAFILQKLEGAEMFPSPDAPKETLLRRVTYSLTGLPPTPQELQAFLADNTPQAWTRVVERLLASPQYGERWGRHWLDTARYADTAGSNADNLDYRFPHAWTYRDWVIKAINDDMPYDQFIVHQLAADYLPKEQQGPKGENLAALGFITVGERFGNVNDQINERIDTVSKGFFGLTVSCARCHDHMFDPISQKDYYAMHGIFASISEPRVKPRWAISAARSAPGFLEAGSGSNEGDRGRLLRHLGQGESGLPAQSPALFRSDDPCRARRRRCRRARPWAPPGPSRLMALSSARTNSMKTRRRPSSRASISATTRSSGRWRA